MPNVITLRAIAGEALSVSVFRGFAKLNDLAAISRADVYDPDKNVEGTQRDLNVAHARSAYDYAASASPREKHFWPEVILNIRRNKGVKISSVSKVRGGGEFVKVQVDLNAVDLREIDPSISRVDGNHRLYFAMGDAKRKLKALEVVSPFAITRGLSKSDELQIFRDINHEQRSMNTAHLDNIEYRLSPEEEIFKNSPHLWFAEALATRESSPFAGAVYRGGKRDRGRYIITLRGLESALKELLGSSQQLSRIPKREHQYRLVENYWKAVNATWPDEWRNSRDFKLMTNTPGLTALGRVGGKLLDVQLRKNAVSKETLENAVAQLKPLINWRKNSEMMRGMAGPGAAKVVAQVLETGLPDEVEYDKLEI